MENEKEQFNERSWTNQYIYQQKFLTLQAQSNLNLIENSYRT